MRSAADALYEKAIALERQGSVKEALRAYRQAAKAGSAKAAKRLAEYYKAYEKVQDPGVPVEGGWGCPPKC